MKQVVKLYSYALHGHLNKYLEEKIQNGMEVQSVTPTVYDNGNLMSAVVILNKVL